MTDAKTPPKLGGTGTRAADARKARLAAALRENLRKRKVQARQREAAADAPSGGVTGDKDR